MKKLTSFVADYWLYVLKGDAKFYAWLGFLSLLIFGWVYGNYHAIVARHDRHRADRSGQLGVVFC